MLKLIRMIMVTFIFLISSYSYAEFFDTEGHKLDFKNKWVILNYWADWCESCMAEMPELNHFYQNNKNKNVVMLGVNYDHLPLDLLKSSISKSNVLFPVITEDPTLVWNIGQIDIIPSTFIINPQGKIVEKIVGQSSETMLKQLICDQSKTIYC